MSDLPYVAIAIALNPNLAEQIKKNPKEATESVGLRLSSDELARVTNMVGATTIGGMPPVVGSLTPVTWGRLIKNRAFIGELIASPEATLRKYNLKMDNDAMLRLGDEVDRILDRASVGLDAGGNAALLHCSNACL